MPEIADEALFSESVVIGQKAIFKALFRHGAALLKARAHPTLHHVMRYAQENLTEPITLTAAASAVGLEACSLSRMCSRDLGITFKTLLNALRIYIGAVYLLSDGYTIVSVAKSVGFRDVQAFTRVFKHITGLSPVAFMRVADLATLQMTILQESGAYLHEA